MAKSKSSGGYRVLRKVRHNGVEYNPTPGLTHVRKNRLADGTTLLTPVALRGFAGNANAPTEIPASAFEGPEGERQLRQLIDAKTVEDPDNPVDIRPEALVEKESAKLVEDAKANKEGEIIPAKHGGR